VGSIKDALQLFDMPNSISLDHYCPYFPDNRFDKTTMAWANGTQAVFRVYWRK